MRLKAASALEGIETARAVAEEEGALGCGIASHAVGDRENTHGSSGRCSGQIVQGGWPWCAGTCGEDRNRRRSARKSAGCPEGVSGEGGGLCRGTDRRGYEICTGASRSPHPCPL